MRFTAVFWKDTLERALKTAAQVFATVLIAARTGLLDTDWKSALSAAGMAAVLSVLTSLGSEVVNPTGTASLLTLPGHPAPPTRGKGGTTEQPRV